jgi:hypothetical protein
MVWRECANGLERGQAAVCRLLLLSVVWSVVDGLWSCPTSWMRYSTLWLRETVAAGRSAAFPAWYVAAQYCTNTVIGILSDRENDL